MMRKSLPLVLAALLAMLLTTSRAQAWGAYHVGFTHVGYGGVYHYGRTGVAGYGGYGGVARYGAVGYGGVYGARYGYRGYGAYGGYHYGGAAYDGAYGGAARYGYAYRY